ncbi:hypothetical protein HGH93_02155 [Chitinophaga polysaccharea]|uniref:hypothetical protein n=1 Tax=Chitinophaga polysaccharea TaxID=1293035 RepID=UPI001454F8F5|nr:hypothetical protein [Chitinophaga polysaccharea]NLR56887.1 hypothetical protein [Chitinophaga polysaccharea]
MPGTPLQIDKDKAVATAMDFDALMTEAIARVQELSGTEWTDYNLHDPGVTILQQLCYAITDLAYRTSFPIEDILADKKNNIEPLDHSFFRKAEMLTSSPVTVNDYRKMVLDEIDAIENIWIEPVQTWQPSGCTKGVYRVFIQVEDNIAENMKANEALVQQLAEQVDNLLHAYRNIGEDFERAVILQPQYIYIKAEIFVDSRQDPQQILALMCNSFEMTLHPPVRFVSAAEMYINGYTAADMYAGPLLKKGFVVDSDLHNRKAAVDPADLMKSVSEVPGVIKVKAIYLADEDGAFQAKPVRIKEGFYPFLEMVNDKHEIKISSDRFEYNLRDAGFLNMYEQVKTVARRKFAGHKNAEASKPLKGTYRNLGKYFSIQEQFPAIYGIGSEGLEKEAPALRKAQARQLKAYLLFFEQVLTNYLAQLNNIGPLFSPYLRQTPAATYATQPLYDVPQVAALLKAFTDEQPGASWEHFRENTGNAYMKKLQAAIEPDKVFQDRKNRILDHLLARFNLVLLKYPVNFYEQVYAYDAPSQRISHELEWKADILRHLPTLSANRNRSFNYREDIYAGSELSGYENLLHKLLHIRVEKRKRLTAAFDTGSWKVSAGKHSDTGLHVHLVKEFKVKDELIKVNMAESESGEVTTGKRFDYGRQSVSLLRYGLDIKNYRVILDDETNSYLVVYRQSPHALWQVVSREKTHKEALDSLLEMMGHLKKMSIDSEGCYLLEHLLLKPAYGDQSFGYRICSGYDTLRLQHARWLTLEERDEQLRKLLAMVASMQEPDPYKHWQLLMEDHRIYFYPGNSPEILTAEHFRQDAYRPAAERAMTDLLLLLRQMKTNQPRRIRMEPYVKYGTSQMLQEDFFKFGISILLPSWPARFQYKEFRSFAEELFREHTAVQFRMHYKWLGIADMQTFESLYFNWLKTMRGEGDRPEASEGLIKLLLKDPAFAHYVVNE